MINELVNDIKKTNEELLAKKQSIKELQTIVDILNKIIKFEKIKDQELLLITEYYNKKVVSKDMQISFVLNVILKSPLKIEINETQINALSSLKQNIEQEIHNFDISKIDDELKNNELLVKKLSTDEIFDNYKELASFFRDNNIDMSKRIEILMYLLKSNSQKNVNSVNIPKQDDSLENVLQRYGINISNDRETYDLLNNKNINDISRILEKLNGLSLVTNPLDIYQKNRQLFIKIILYSSVEILENVEKICNDEKIDINELLSSHINVLIPSAKQNNIQKIVTKTSKIIGQYNNFVTNINFFKNKGFDIAKIFNSCLSVLVKSSETNIRNYELLTNLYGIDMKDGKSLTALLNGQAISLLDRFIEISEFGYDYVKGCKSVLFNTKDETLYKIKILNALKKDEEVEKRAHDALNSSNLNENVFYRQLNGRIVKRKELLDKITDNLDILKNVLGIDDKNNPEIEIDFDSQLTIDMGVFNNMYISYLEDNFKDDDYTYVIKDIRVSRIKVLRIISHCIQNGLNVGENEIIFAIKYKSILSSNELKNINEAIRNIQGQIGGIVNEQLAKYRN